MSQDPLHLLCVEPHFPGRLGAIADWLVRRRGYRCRFLCSRADPRSLWPRSVGHGLDVVFCPVTETAAVDWTRYLERGLSYAMRYFEALEAQRPAAGSLRLPPFDLVVGRSAGLGSTLFVPVHQPGIPVVGLFEYFYHPHRHDLAEEMPPTMSAVYRHWRRSANAMDLLDLENGARPWTPTAWQRDLYPEQYRCDFQVLHDGVDTVRFQRAQADRPVPRTIGGRPLSADTRVVTFVARATDRVRGIDRFLVLANRLLRARSDVLCVVIGSPVVQRGLDVQFFNRDYRAHLLAESPLADPSRVWFLDQVEPTVVAEALAASDLHVYPGRTYSVSRSLLEAMSAGCVILAADTAPVREVLTHERTGLVIGATDVDAWYQHAVAALDDRAVHRPLGEAAADVARQEYCCDVNLPRLAEWFGQVARSYANAI
jgi:glycosyltransferase involved in cell wall biosynthesis